MEAETLYLTRIKNDTCGNPRYVVHFLQVNTRDELNAVPWMQTGDKYAVAVKRANTIGGRKFHNKQYGGGIVFQSYSVDELRASIARVTGRNYTAQEVSR